MISNNLFQVPNEENVANQLYKAGFLPGPGKCSCESESFSIRIDNSNFTSGICFRCTNNKCRKKFSIRINSLFAKFPQIKLRDLTEIINCFICLEFNTKKAVTYLKENKNVIISQNTLSKIYKEFRNIIYQYMKIVYNSEVISTENNNDYFAVDESLINHINNKQVWLLGIINNNTKDFRIEGAYNRDTNTLSNFISTYVEKGNVIISDGWQGYNYLNSHDSGYQHLTFMHINGIFGQGIQSTSHIEAIWGIIKSKIKSIYNVIPHKNFMKFVREAEYRYKVKDKTGMDKIKEFFDCYRLTENVSDVKFPNVGFISSSDEDNSEDFED